MGRIDTEADLARGIEGLAAIEPRFGEAARVAGPIPLRRWQPGFATLMRVLTGQQLSVAAADGIRARLEDQGLMSPGAVLGVDDEALRACGLSRSKVRYARAMAEAVEGGTLDLDVLPAMPVEDAVAALTAVKGIGTWTAEIYLMFAVGHRDVFAPKDLALQEGARTLFGWEERPTDRALAEAAQAWSPWRAVAARILWRWYRHAKGREGIS